MSLSFIVHLGYRGILARSPILYPGAVYDNCGAPVSPLCVLRPFSPVDKQVGFSSVYSVRLLLLSAYLLNPEEAYRDFD
jgi:hypothetical protein